MDGRDNTLVKFERIDMKKGEWLADRLKIGEK